MNGGTCLSCCLELEICYNIVKFDFRVLGRLEVDNYVIQLEGSIIWNNLFEWYQFLGNIIVSRNDYYQLHKITPLFSQIIYLWAEIPKHRINGSPDRGCRILTLKTYYFKTIHHRPHHHYTQLYHFQMRSHLNNLNPLISDWKLVTTHLLNGLVSQCQRT